MPNESVRLQLWPEHADTLSMLNAEAEILDLDLNCCKLLQEYRDRCLAARADVRAAAAADAAAVLANSDLDTADTSGAESVETVPRSDPWVARIDALRGLDDPDQLCVLHGKLIAAGLITFQIRNRQAGVEYRVSNAGKQFLNRTQDADADGESDGFSDAHFQPADDRESLADYGS